MFVSGEDATGDNGAAPGGGLFYGPAVNKIALQADVLYNQDVGYFLIFNRVSVVKKLCMFLVGVFFLAGVNGCGRGAVESPEPQETPRVPSLNDLLPAAIPVFPGAEEISYPDDYAVLGEGVKVTAFEAPAGLVEVYGFYADALPGRGLRPSGNIILSDTPHFILEVTRDGADYAIIHASEHEGITRIVIWSSIGS